MRRRLELGLKTSHRPMSMLTNEANAFLMYLRTVPRLAAQDRSGAYHILGQSLQ